MKRNLVEAYDSHDLDMNNEENFHSLPYNFSPPSNCFRCTSRSIVRFYRTYEHMHIQLRPTDDDRHLHNSHKPV